MKKLVPENLQELKENWVSDYSGKDVYGDISYNLPNSNDETDIDEDKYINTIIPPQTYKFNAQSFKHYINNLIKALPEDPIFIFKIFDKTLKLHPYLIRKPIGFTSKNEYEPIIRKFELAVEKLEKL